MDEAAVLRSVSVFAKSFCVEGALAVSSAGPAKVFDALGQLVAKSLLAVDTTGGAITYRLLDSTRAYGNERLHQSGEDEVVRGCHAEHVCALLGRAAEEWAESAPAEWGARYGPLIDDLRGPRWSGPDRARRS